MIEANDCKIGDIYEEIPTGQIFIVKEYNGNKVFEYFNQPGLYTTALNKKHHRKKS